MRIRQRVGDKGEAMGGYMLPVAMEVFRRGFDKPEALVPGRPEEFVINLHQINHLFKRGHRNMEQVQSTLVPGFC